MTSDSQVTIYFHGTPGSPLELLLFGRPAPTDWHALDRALLGDAIPPKDHFDGIADVVRKRGAGHALRLVGFSLGLGWRWLWQRGWMVGMFTSI